MSNGEYIVNNTRKFWKATFALGLGSFSVFSNLHMAQPLLPLFSKDFEVSAATASLAISLITFTLSIFLLVFGPISDAIGRKNIMSTGLILSSIISILIFFAPSFNGILVLRALQGVFLAGLPAIAYAYIGEEFHGNSIGVVIGIYISGTSIGGMSARIISGFVADVSGWEYAFLVIGIMGLISAFIFMIMLPDSKNFRPKKLSGFSSLKVIANHWKNPVLRQAYYISAIIYSIFLGLFNYIGYYLHHAPYHLSSTYIGLLYLTYLAGTYSSTYSGRLAKKISNSVRIFLGLSIMFLGLLLMFFTPLIIILAGLIIFIFGFFFTHAAASSWVSKYATEAKASASSLYLFSYYMGGSVISFLLGFLWPVSGFIGIIFVTILILLIGMTIAWKMKYIENHLSEGQMIQQNTYLN